MKIQLASKSTCTGCLACVDSCNEKAIQGHIHKDGHLYPQIDHDLCVKCGRCMKVCPVISRYDYQNIEANSQPYAVWANDEKIRYNGASGGFFGALAVHVLTNGGWVAGASMEGLEVKHILISDIKELYKIQNSKYQQVDSSGIYKAVKEKLEQGDVVLFGGTSCQIAGLNCFLEKNQFQGKLYTVDMICSGFPSRKALNALLRNEKDKINTLIYRDKEDGWKAGQRLSVVIEGDREHRVKKVYRNDLIYAVFGTHYTHRSSCLRCPFTYAQRKVDITMGDFWGDTDFPEQHEKGISLVIVHSGKGLELLRNSNISQHRSFWNKISLVNFRIVYGNFYTMPFHPARIFQNWIFNYCSYSTLMKIYRGERGNVCWSPYILYSKFLGLIEMIIRKRIVKKKLQKLH